MKIIVVLFLLYVGSYSETIARNSTPIKIGEKLPDLTFSIVNQDQKSVQFSALKGKLVIIDIWTTWCGACIARLPKMHELQKKYPDEVTVLLVNDGEPIDKVLRFLAKRESLSASRVSLPVILGDSMLTKVLLKHDGLPAYFFFDRNGFLVNAAEGANQGENEMEDFIKGSSVKMVKVQKGENRTLWQSELQSGVKPGANKIELTQDGKSKITYGNSSITDLYRFAYGKFYKGSERSRSFVDPLPINRVLFESTFILKGGRFYGHRVQSDSLYSYTQIAPNFSSWEKMSSVMKSDLNNWFGLNSSIEKRIVKYLSLSIPDTMKFKDVSGKMIFKISDIELSLNNISIKEFLRNINSLYAGGRYFLGDLPIVDASGYNGMIGNISIEGISLTDVNALDKEFEKAGIRLQLVTRPLDMLVIQDAEKIKQ